MLPNKPSDLLPFVHADIDLNSKVAFDFVGSNVEVGPNVVVVVLGLTISSNLHHSAILITWGKQWKIVLYLAAFRGNIGFKGN